jgi:hypothetical protein
MHDLPAALFRGWIHSHEEDTPGVQVYRPRGHPFPPARGRVGFEIRKDGTFIYFGIAATDGSSQKLGSWEPAGPGRIEVSFAAGAAAPFSELEIETVDARKLTIRRG